MTDQRALLASPGLDGQPVKGVYFFAGEGSGNRGLYTTHPLSVDDLSWNSDTSSRARVVDRICASHANTLVMSYWSDMQQWSPMKLDETSLCGVLEAAVGRPLVILPAIEGGFDKAHPEIAHWEFGTDFPSPTPDGPVAPGLIERIGGLVELFRGRMDQWARLYDREGRPRYAVQIIHACSELPGTTDQSFTQGFADVAAEIARAYDITVGFTLDLIGGPHAYVAAPAAASHLLEAEPSVLAVNGFQSEVFSPKVQWGQPGGPPTDNNVNNLDELARWKRVALHDWAATGVPVILDVSNGMDGRFVWKDSGPAFWGDNLDYTDDRWRNWMSQLKHPIIAGITFDTWNGYTEGYAAVPSTEHGYTVSTWLTDLLEPDPRSFNHMHYVAGTPTHRVYGAICEKWLSLDADRGYGVPTTDESAAGHGRVTYFNDGIADKAIYWSSTTGAHEVHGLIAQTYWQETTDSGRLGLPISDQQPIGDGQLSRFEHGQIEWYPGDNAGRIVYY